MSNNTNLVKCCRCGYSFEPQSDLRCPRCFSPILNIGGCTGSCSSCSARQGATKDNRPPRDRKINKSSR